MRSAVLADDISVCCMYDIMVFTGNSKPHRRTANIVIRRHVFKPTSALPNGRPMSYGWGPQYDVLHPTPRTSGPEVSSCRWQPFIMEYLKCDETSEELQIESTR